MTLYNPFSYYPCPSVALRPFDVRLSARYIILIGSILCLTGCQTPLQDTLDAVTARLPDLNIPTSQDPTSQGKDISENESTDETPIQNGNISLTEMGDTRAHTQSTNTIPPSMPTSTPGRPTPENKTIPETSDLDGGSLPDQLTLHRKRSVNRIIQNALPPVQKEGDRVKIAILLPLSGPSASLGEIFFQAAELSLFQLGIDYIELLPRDTQGTRDGAVRAVQDALATGAQLIIGPVFAQNVEAVAPIARLAEVKVLSFTTEQRVTGDGIFTLGFTPEKQMDRVIQYATSQGVTRFAILAPDTPYGNKIISIVASVATQYDAKLVDIVQYAPDAESLSDEMKTAVRSIAEYTQRKAALEKRKRTVKQALESDPEDQNLINQLSALSRRQTYGKPTYQALILPESGARLRSIATLLPHYDVDPDQVRLIGTGQWADPGLGREPALSGGWFASPRLADAVSGQSFQETYQRAYGVSPPVIASLMFDAVALAVLLAPDGTPDYSVSSLTQSGGFIGRKGIFRLTPDGVAEHGLAVIELTPMGFREIDPAPQSFKTPVSPVISSSQTKSSGPPVTNQSSIVQN